MIIKSNEKAYEIVKTEFILVMVTGMGLFLMAWIYGESWRENLLIIISVIFLFLLVAHDWIKDCKKIILSNVGCEIILGPFKRSFCWDEMQTKKAENYSAIEAFVKNYGKGIYFAKKTQKRMFLKHSRVMRPLSSFRVFFSETKVRDYWWDKGSRHDKPDCYAVEEKNFLEQMERWGIVIEPADKEFIGLEKIRRQMNVRPASVKENEEDGTVA